MAEQVRDPFRILHIGLTPWHLLDVLRVRHHNLQGPLPEWRRSASSTPPCSPAPHEYSLRRATIRADLPGLASSSRMFAFASGLFRPGEPSTSKPLPWPDVRPIQTTFNQSLHDASIGGDCCAAGLVQTLSCVLPVSGCDKRWYLYRRGSVLSAGSVSSHRLPTFKQSPTTDPCITD